jgi:serine/threonine-protein kinase
MSLKIGDAGYRILGPIASGGMGDVYKAEHVITKRIEAIKLLSGGGTDEETDRFLREIQLQASLSHPNIAAVYNAFRVGDDLVMVMELVEGEPLRALLAKGRLSLPIALNYAGQVLQAVAYAHAHGVIHRDISPSNIIVTEQGKIKLMDFGLAKALASPAASQAGSSMGSPHYMSPEQVRDASQASARSDIYSLGAVFYEMATGRKVFEGESSFLVMQAQVQGTPVPPKQLEPAIPAAINDAILKALEKDPQRRFPTAAAFREAIEDALKKTPVPPSSHPRRSRWPSGLQFAATCAVILLPTAYFAGSRSARLARKIEPPVIRIQAPAPPAVVQPMASAPAIEAVKPPVPRPVTRRARLSKPLRPGLSPAAAGEERAAPGAPKTPPLQESEPVRPVAATPVAPPLPHGAEPAPAYTQPAPAPSAVATPVEPAAPEAAAESSGSTAKEKKPRSRLRRALSKILGR